MPSRRFRGADVSLLLVIAALFSFLFLIPADFTNFFSSRLAPPSPPPYTPPKTVQCPKCPDPITCPAPAPLPDPGANAFCRASVSRCNKVGIPDEKLCRLLTDVLNSNYTEEVCSTHENSAGASIPHLIHQSWKEREGLPLNFKTWSQSWTDTHPDWKYKFWSDQYNDDFISTHYGWLNDTYSKLPAVINRADMVRYLYMFREGGVYADMDTWLLRKLDSLHRAFTECQGQKAIVAMLSEDVEFRHNIPNAWMASSPGHPFWLFLVRVIQERYTDILMREAQGDKDADVGVESLTGPVVLKEAYDTWQCTFGDMSNIEAIEAGYVFVSNWNDEEKASYFRKKCQADQITTEQQQKQCLKAFPNAHVITFWTHTWTDPWFEKHKDDDKIAEEQQQSGGEKELDDDEKLEKDYSYEDEGDYH